MNKKIIIKSQVQQGVQEGSHPKCNVLIKKLKTSPEPVAAMAVHGPEVKGLGGGQSMSDACQSGKSVRRLPNGLSASNLFQKTLGNRPGAK